MKTSPVQQDGQPLVAYDSLEALQAAESGYYADASSEICYVKVPDTAKASAITLHGTSIPTYEFEAEDAEILGNAQSETVFGGYTGSGYVAWLHDAGDGVRFSNIKVPEEGDYTVFLRYANGSGATQTMSVYANGNEEDAQQVFFASMKDFTLWDEVPVTVHLNAGENTLPSFCRKAIRRTSISTARR